MTLLVAGPRRSNGKQVGRGGSGVHTCRRARGTLHCGRVLLNERRQREGVENKVQVQETPINQQQLLKDTLKILGIKKKKKKNFTPRWF